MKFLIFAALISSINLFASNSMHKSESIRKITVVNFEQDGVKQWRPGTIAAYKGETVELTLKNTAKKPHGYQIKAMGVKEVINGGESKTIKFKVKEHGIHKIDCQLHGAHVGGQLIAL